MIRCQRLGIILSSLIFLCQGFYQEAYNQNLIVITDTQEYKGSFARIPDLEFVDLEDRIEGIFLDIRYATKNNFTTKVIYTTAKAFVRQPVAIALQKVQDSLATHGLGLKIFDAYRPYAATVKFFEVYPDTNFVADPRFGSRHNRGCAVDISLINLETRLEIPMPTDYDDFSDKAHPMFMDLPQDILRNRAFLFGVMAHFGFQHYPTEWWHFDFIGWEHYPLMDLSFEALEKISQHEGL